MILPVLSAPEAPVMDYSAASTLYACARKYELQYVQGWRPKGGEPVYLRAGTAVHAAFESLYTLRWDLGAAMDALRASWGDFAPPRSGKHAYLTLGHLEIVLERYFEDRSENPTALEAATIEDAGREHAEAALVVDWVNARGEVIRIGGKPDLPTALAGERYIVDTKTTTGWLNDFWYKRYRLGHQFRTYAGMLGQVTGRKYSGAYVNAVYIGEKAADEPDRWKGRQSVPNALYGPQDYSDGHLEETWDWHASAQALAEFYSARGVWPQNEAACDAYGGCQFLEVCERAPQVRKAVLAMNFERVRPTGRLLSGADGTESVR